MLFLLFYPILAMARHCSKTVKILISTNINFLFHSNEHLFKMVNQKFICQTNQNNELNNLRTDPA